MKAKKILRERLSSVGDAISEGIDEAVADILEPYLERLASADKKLAEVEHKVSVLYRTSTVPHVRNRKR